MKQVDQGHPVWRVYCFLTFDGKISTNLTRRVRLTTAQAELIKQRAREFFGREADVWLFGSRADDDMRGGDIDLVIESQVAISGRVSEICQRHAALQRDLGKQKIDIIALDPSMTVLPIHESAKRTGVRL